MCVMATSALAFSSNALQAQNGIDFDGVDDRIDCGNDTSVQIVGKTISLEAWIYPTSFKTNPWDCNVICKEDNSTNNGYNLRVGGSGQLNFAMGNGTSTWAERNSPNNVLVLNQWQHVAGTYDGKRMRLYVNGIAIDSFDVATSITNTASSINLTIGDHTGSYQRRFQGMIDEVRIWKTCRTSSQIKANMNDEFCSSQTGLRAYYKFNQGKAAGNNISTKNTNDLSGFKNTGTMQNFAWTGSNSNWVTGKSMKKSSTLTTQTLTACDLFISASGRKKWTASGTYYDTVQNMMTCDSIIKYVLTLKKKSTSSMKVFDCKNFKSPSGLYTWSKTGTYTDYLTNSVGCDSVITIYLKIGTTPDSISVSDCKQVISPSGKYKYKLSGRYSDTLKSYRGCDSIVFVKVNILPSSTGEITVSDCRKFKSPSGKYTYTSTGTYYDTIANEIGCDSVITIHFSIILSERSIIRSACESFKSPSGMYTYTKSGIYKDTLINYMGCDSIVTIKLTIFEPGTSTQTISACRYYILPNARTVIEKSGTYKETLTNWKGCDSIITYNVTIKKIDNSIIQDGSLLKANSTTASYQWLNCSQGYRVIVGETKRTYAATANLKYAVELSENGCKDTSDCIQVVNASNINLNSQEVVIVPNPSSGRFELKMNYEGKIHVLVTNTMGAIVYEAFTSKAVLCPVELNVKPGLYQVHVFGEDFSTSKSLVIQP